MSDTLSGDSPLYGPLSLKGVQPVTCLYAIENEKGDVKFMTTFSYMTANQREREKNCSIVLEEANNHIVNCLW